MGVHPTESAYTRNTKIPLKTIFKQFLPFKT